MKVSKILCRLFKGELKGFISHMQFPLEEQIVSELGILKEEETTEK